MHETLKNSSAEIQMNLIIYIIYKEANISLISAHHSVRFPITVMFSYESSVILRSSLFPGH